MFYGGGAGLLVDQFLGGLAIAAFVSLTAGLLFLAMKSAGVLRVSPEEEIEGLDVAEHGAPGYGPDMMAGVAGGGVPTGLDAPVKV